MSLTSERLRKRLKRRRRIRHSVQGRADRPRLSVFRSLKHMYAQAIDDVQGRTLASVSTMEADLRKELSSHGGVAAAERVGREIGKRLSALGVQQVVFDRGGYRYHGRVKALADAARESGLRF